MRSGVRVPPRPPGRRLAAPPDTVTVSSCDGVLIGPRVRTGLQPCLQGSSAPILVIRWESLPQRTPFAGDHYEQSVEQFSVRHKQIRRAILFHLSCRPTTNTVPTSRRDLDFLPAAHWMAMHGAARTNNRKQSALRFRDYSVDTSVACWMAVDPGDAAPGLDAATQYNLAPHGQPHQRNVARRSPGGDRGPRRRPR